jgi:hypothetical protein
MSSTTLQSGLTFNMTMKEACQAMIDARRNRARGHRLKHAHDGMCSGLTQSEYNRMTVRQKSTFSKARKFTHNRMWKETHKKFDTKQLNIIKKCI